MKLFWREPITESEEVAKWLRTHGPLAQIESTIKAAAKAKRKGRHGKAYTLYLQAANIDALSPVGQKAGEEASAIADKADAAFEKAEQALASNDLASAKRLLAAIARRYSGCEIGGRAREKLKQVGATASSEDHEPTARPSTKHADGAVERKANEGARRCRGWWSMAQNYLRIGRAESARKYLTRITQEYPDSEWAKKAQASLRDLGPEQ